MSQERKRETPQFSGVCVSEWWVTPKNSEQTRKHVHVSRRVQNDLCKKNEKRDSNSNNNKYNGHTC